MQCRGLILFSCSVFVYAWIQRIFGKTILAFILHNYQRLSIYNAYGSREVYSKYPKIITCNFANQLVFLYDVYNGLVLKMGVYFDHSSLQIINLLGLHTGVFTVLYIILSVRPAVFCCF